MSKLMLCTIPVFVMAGAGMNTSAGPLSGQAKQLYDLATKEAKLTLKRTRQDVRIEQPCPRRVESRLSSNALKREVDK